MEERTTRTIIGTPGVLKATAVVIGVGIHVMAFILLHQKGVIPPVEEVIGFTLVMTICLFSATSLLIVRLELTERRLTSYGFFLEDEFSPEDVLGANGGNGITIFLVDGSDVLPSARGATAANTNRYLLSNTEFAEKIRVWAAQSGEEDIPVSIGRPRLRSGILVQVSACLVWSALFCFGLYALSL